MKKLLLLLPLLFLCSCNNNDISGIVVSGSNGETTKYNVDIYELGKTKDDNGYVYLATIDYLHNAKLQLYKYKSGYESIVVKEWDFGKYNVIYEKWNNEYLYDYGSFAIYRPSGLK